MKKITYRLDNYINILLKFKKKIGFAFILNEKW